MPLEIGSSAANPLALVKVVEALQNVYFFPNDPAMSYLRMPTSSALKPKCRIQASTRISPTCAALGQSKHHCGALKGFSFFPFVPQPDDSRSGYIISVVTYNVNRGFLRGSESELLGQLVSPSYKFLLPIWTAVSVDRQRLTAWTSHRTGHGRDSDVFQSSVPFSDV